MPFRLLLALLLSLAAFADAPGEKLAGPPPDARAIVAVDARLHALLADDLAAWTKAASARRKFPIAILPVDGLDDLAPPDVRKRIGEWRSTCPKLEGVVLIGNVKFPSFFMPRADTPSTRYWTRYYEDQDGVFEQRIKPGAVLHKPTKDGERPCIVCADEFTVPEHDFDWVDQGPAKGCEVRVALFTAATGSPHNRVDDDCYAPLLADLFADGYLGRAHLRQLAEQERLSTDPMGLRGRQEILIGDPFVDANR